MTQASLKIGLLFLLTLALAAGLTGTAQAKPPLTAEQVITIVTASKFGITVERAVEMIRERGIGFTVTDAFLKQLEAQEADAAIVTVVKELGGNRRTTVQPTAAPGILPAEPEGPEKAPPPPPPPPDVDLLPLGTVPTAENWTQFLESVRNRVLRYAHSLPDFVCNQGTRSYQAFGRRGWTQREIYEVEVSYFDQSPHYRQISKYPLFRDVGEFGPVLTGVFAPRSQATFKLQGLEKKHGRSTARVSFQVPRETSLRPIQVKDEGMVPFGYRGRFWVDLETQLLVRLESRSTDMPRRAPITDEEMVLRYKEVMLVDKLVWLPAELHVIVKTDAMGDGGLSSGVLNAGGTPNFQTGDKTSLRWVSFYRNYRPFEPE
ncbi:MAG: hypothetical protein OXU26_05995 [Acidobacteriota bacterium]|nr:hypothetical protein [Acidobacteriota bacterium]MDE2963442.1 hypothetical protein [Acidobacteriota bacterium]